jgi:hypothetical protein
MRLLVERQAACLKKPFQIVKDRCAMTRVVRMAASMRASLLDLRPPALCGVLQEGAAKKGQKNKKPGCS